MERACFVHKAHPNGNIGVILIVQAVNSTLSKEGTAGNGKGDASAMLLFPRPFPPVMTVGLPNTSSVGSS